MHKYISQKEILSFIQSKKCTEAQEEFDNLISDFNDHPATPGVVYWFAKEFEALKTYDRALGYYQKVADYYPRYDLAWNALFRVCNINQVLKKSGAISKSDADLKTKAAY